MDNLIKMQYVYESFDEERIKQVGALLADPKNSVTLLLSKSLKEEELT